jgi:glutamyl-Q tRNA(Asp) synthetase
MSIQQDYVGRFAPSPTGPLHFGSLVAAVASYLDARHNKGRWLVRMEDLDPPREQPGADSLIISALDQLGLHWDGQILYQSRRIPAYQAVLADLKSQDRVFPCICARKSIGRTYPGTCRKRKFADMNTPHSIRLRIQDASDITLEDQYRGSLHQQLTEEPGDFIVRRKDGLFAYQLAVVADDEYQGITHIIRGADLVDSTFRQIYLQKVLGYRTPVYGHIPIITDPSGTKLSKQTHAPELDLRNPCKCVFFALQALGQQPPKTLLRQSVSNLLAWAIDHWKPEVIGKDSIEMNSIF